MYWNRTCEGHSLNTSIELLAAAMGDVETKANIMNRTIDGHEGAIAYISNGIAAMYILEDHGDVKTLVTIHVVRKDKPLPAEWIELPISTLHVERVST